MYIRSLIHLLPEKALGKWTVTTLDPCAYLLAAVNCRGTLHFRKPSKFTSFLRGWGVPVTSSVEHQYVMCTLVCIREDTLQQMSVQQHSIKQ